MSEKKKSPKPHIKFVLTTGALIEFCHDEIVALASKMAEFERNKS